MGIALILAGLGGMAVMAAYEQPNTWTGSSTGLSGDVSGGAGWPMSGNMDAMFIEQMVPHHDDAIAMADIALTRAEHPELKRLAADIKRTQTAENTQMKGWYKDWFGADVPDVPSGTFGMMGGGMMGGVVDMGVLEDAKPFDKAFIEQMIPHHQMAIMMSQMAGSFSARPEMRGLTQSIISAQSREIQQMQEWYRRWYGS